MNALRDALCWSVAVLLCASAVRAGDPSTWISMNQAVTIATQQVPGAVPFKAELNEQNGFLRYEVLLFQNNIMYKVRINPNNGNVGGVSQNTGGGAQDKIATAQAVIAQSAFTLSQAIAIGEQNWPNYYLVQVDMRLRDGVGVFHLEFIRGPMKLQIEFRASDGVIVRNRLYANHPDAATFEIFTGDPDDLLNVEGIIDARQMITRAQNRFPGAVVYKIELYELTNGTRRYQIDLFAGDRLIRTKFNASTGGFVNGNVVTDPQAVNRVAQAMATPQISLTQAINIAVNRVPNGVITEARLRTQENGQRYQIEIMTTAGFVQVRVNSTTGGVTLMWYDT